MVTMVTRLTLTGRRGRCVLQTADSSTLCDVTVANTKPGVRTVHDVSLIAGTVDVIKQVGLRHVTKCVAKVRTRVDGAVKQ